MNVRHGPELLDGAVCFRLWAPRASAVRVRVNGTEHALIRRHDGWWEARVAGARAGDRYTFSLQDERTLPDPAALRLPLGVHGPAELWDAKRFGWQHANPSILREELVFYELHVGTFTAEGTFDAAARRLPDLAALGITCVELMPVQPFPGSRNWGYDGVAPHAVHEGYGGPDERGTVEIRSCSKDWAYRGRPG